MSALLSLTCLKNQYRALLRHGLSIWIDVPLNMVTMGAVEVQSEDSASEVFISETDFKAFGDYSA